MASRSHGFSWFVVGFLSGIALTLAILIVTGGRVRREPIRIDAPVAVAAAPRKAEIAAPQAPAPLPPLQTPSEIDQQVAEDAAATGMTSRSRAPAEH